MFSIYVQVCKRYGQLTFELQVKVFLDAQSTYLNQIINNFVNSYTKNTILASFERTLELYKSIQFI
jgi:hypothetical protein